MQVVVLYKHACFLMRTIEAYLQFGQWIFSVLLCQRNEEIWAEPLVQFFGCKESPWMVDTCFYLLYGIQMVSILSCVRDCHTQVKTSLFCVTSEGWNRVNRQRKADVFNIREAFTSNRAIQIGINPGLQSIVMGLRLGEFVVYQEL